MMLNVRACVATQHLICILCIACMLIAGCAAHIPPEDYAAAEAVLQDAFNAEAAIYAPDEYARAQESLHLSKREMDRHRYKKAQSLLDSAERDAQSALTRAKAGKTIKLAR